MHRSRFVPLALLLVPALLGLAACPGDDGFTSLESEMQVSPTALSFGPVYQGDTRTLLIAVDNTGTAPLVFGTLSPDVENGPASVSLQPLVGRLEAGATTSVEVRLTANTMGAGVYTARVELATERGPSETITIDAEIRPLPECDDQNPCTHDSSDNGECIHTPAINGTPCDDGSACTFATVCVESTCVGQPVECADSVGCTVDYCSPETGCVFEPMNDQCDDGDGCTLDSCNGLVGCLNEPAPIGTVCHLDGCNEIGFCIGTGCAIQPTPDDVPCEDGDFCTEEDRCVAQTCIPGERRETGAADPLVVADAAYSFDLCLHQDTAFPDCEFLGSAGAVVEAPVGEVLATHTGSDGRSLVLWRTAWVSPYGPCQPGSDGSVNGGPPIPPLEDPNDPNDAPPDPPNICGTGVYLTQTDPLTGASAARHLTTTTGLSAGAFALDASGKLIVASVEASGVVTMRAFSVNAADPEADPVTVDYSTERGPAGAITVDLTPLRAAVLVTPAFRNAYATPAACGPQCSCNCDDADLCFCEGGTAPVFVASLSLIGPSAVDQVIPVLPVLETPGNLCAGEQSAARPFEPDALMVRADADTTFAFRLDPGACADLADPPLLDARRVYAGQLSFVVPPLFPISFAPDTIRLRDVDLRAAPLVAAIEVVPEGDCFQEEADLPCLDTFRVVNGQLDGSGIGSIGGFETLIENLGPGPASAHPIILDDGLFTLVRTGLSTQVVRHHPETGLIERVTAPPLAPTTVTADRPTTGAGQAAFVTHSLCAESRTIPSADAGPGEPVCDETTQIVVQRFGCYYGQNESGCLSHDDCEGSAVCAQGPGVCLEPPGCSDDECSTCAGRCVALAECAVDALCATPEGAAPVCPAGTSPHFGLSSDCTWACLDEACAPWLPPSVDGGPHDGGFTDAGDDDAGDDDAGSAGVPDAGQTDGGVPDAGADSGI